jgi:D-alanyl-lipoteichoic acid acyltransferase DltB (MBOAT superfamily)
MEIMLHYCYVVAISKARAWQDSSPFQLSMISYFNLTIIWLKVSRLSFWLTIAPYPMAIFSIMGNGRWH